jgi:hypothetical protein
MPSRQYEIYRDAQTFLLARILGKTEFKFTIVGSIESSEDDFIGTMVASQNAKHLDSIKTLSGQVFWVLSKKKVEA